jgi:hypothetical protein
MVRRANPPLEIVAPPVRAKGLVSRETELAYDAGLMGRNAAPPGVGPQVGLQHEPGGELSKKFLHPMFTTMEREFRVLPDEGMFRSSVSPSSPYQFTVGAYRVPQNMALWLEDYAFAIMLPDAISPYDYRYQEPGRFSGSVGFDINVNDMRGQDLAYQLDPIPTPLARQEYDRAVNQVVTIPGGRGRPTTEDKFNRAAANSFGSTAGVGNALMPVRGRVAGPRSRSFVWPITEGQSVAVRCLVFRPLTTPISGFYAQLSGHLMHINVHQALVERLRVR